MKYVTGVIVAVAISLSYATTAEAFFKTPKGAAYCFYEGSIYCWTPNDGFTVQMAYTDRPTKGYYRANKGEKPRGYPTLKFGKTFRRGNLRCTSRRTGLTCTNARGHGWWLGRYVGYRLF